METFDVLVQATTDTGVVFLGRIRVDADSEKEAGNKACLRAIEKGLQVQLSTKSYPVPVRPKHTHAILVDRASAVTEVKEEEPRILKP